MEILRFILFDFFNKESNNKKMDGFLDGLKVMYFFSIIGIIVTAPIWIPIAAISYVYGKIRLCCGCNK